MSSRSLILTLLFTTMVVVSHGTKAYKVLLWDNRIIRNLEKTEQSKEDDGDNDIWGLPVMGPDTISEDEDDSTIHNRRKKVDATKSIAYDNLRMNPWMKMKALYNYDKSDNNVPLQYLYPFNY